MLVVAGMGVVLALLATRRSVNFDTDSAVYLGVADNIIHGRGITTPFSFLSQYPPARAAGFHGAVPLTHFPPMYPIVLATVGFFGVALDAVARVANALLLGANLFLVGVVVRRLTGRTAWPLATGVMALLLAGPARPYFLVAPHITGRLNWLWMSSSILSEPLFIFVSLSALLLLDERVRWGGSPVRLAALAACCVLAVLTRYVGVSVVAVSVFGLAFIGHRDRRARFGDAAVVALAVAVSIGAWTLYTSVLHHGAGARAFRYHHVHELKPSLLAITEGWLMPLSWSSGVRHTVLAVIGVALVGLATLAVRSRHRPGSSGTQTQPAAQTRLGSILCLFLVAYLGIVVLSREFFDASIPINERILAPLQPVVYALVISLLWWVLRQRSRLAESAIAACCVVVLVGPFAIGVADSRGMVLHGFATPRISALSRAVEHLPRDKFIATDLSEAVFLQTGRPSIVIPMKVNPITGERNRMFDDQVRELGRVVAQRHGVLVFYEATLAALLFPDRAELDRLTTLRVVATYPDGYVAAASPRDLS